MSFTPEQLAQILEVVRHVTMAQQVANTPVDPPALRSEHRGRTIDAKCFRAIAFGCDAGEWSDWSFAFKQTVRSCSRDAFLMMDFVEKQSTEVQEHLLGGEGSGSSGVQAFGRTLRRVVPSGIWRSDDDSTVC